jgi:hypothetical protein
VPTPAPAPAPAAIAPPSRASVVVDLDAMPATAAPPPAADGARDGGRIVVPTRVSTSQTN